MRLLIFIVGLLAAALIGLLTIYSQSASDILLDSLNSGWMMSYLFPRILIILSAVTLTSCVLLLFNASKFMKVVIGILIFGSCIGGYLAVNLPYIDDWNQVGTEVTNVDAPAAHPVEAFLGKQFGSYEGLVCLALPNCPHCINSIPKLEKMQARTNKLNFSVLVFADDSTGVEQFLNHVPSTEIPVFLAPEPDATYALSRGRFPSFLYVKNGEIIHRWSNGQFGYPAMDWIEHGLN
ncbi:MAG: hypothetical protein GC178_08765 [Flavobacteriales bacterium]|nr:hypothetical protein [Flavobacteriales bacterium]